MSVFSDQFLQRILPHLKTQDVIELGLAVPDVHGMIMYHANMSDADLKTCVKHIEKMLADAVGLPGRKLRKPITDQTVADLDRLYNTFRVFAGMHYGHPALRLIIENHEKTLPTLVKYLKNFAKTKIWIDTCIQNYPRKEYDTLFYAIRHYLPVEYIQLLVDHGATIDLQGWKDLTVMPSGILQQYFEILPPDEEGHFLVYVAERDRSLVRVVFEKMKPNIKDSAEVLETVAQCFRPSPTFEEGMQDVDELCEMVCSELPPGSAEALRRLMSGLLQPSFMKILLKYGHWTIESLQCMYMMCFQGRGDLELLEGIYATGVPFTGIEEGKVHDPIALIARWIGWNTREVMEPVFRFALDHFPMNPDTHYISDLCEELRDVNSFGHFAEEQMYDVVWALELLLDNGASAVHEIDSIPCMYFMSSKKSMQEGFDLLMQRGGDINAGGGLIQIVLDGRCMGKLMNLFEKYEEHIQWDYYDMARNKTIFSSILDRYSLSDCLTFMDRFPAAVHRTFMMDVSDSIGGPATNPTVLLFMQKHRTPPQAQSLEWLTVFLCEEAVETMDISKVVNNHTGASSIVTWLMRWNMLDRYPHLYPRINWLSTDRHGYTFAHILIQQKAEVDTICRALHEQVAAGWDINSTTNYTDDYSIGNCLVNYSRDRPGLIAKVLETFPQLDMNIVRLGGDTPLFDLLHQYVRYGRPYEQAVIELVATDRVDMLTAHPNRGYTPGQLFISTPTAAAKAIRAAVKRQQEKQQQQKKRQRVDDFF